MGISTSKFFRRQGLLGFSLIFFACNHISNVDKSQTTPSPEPLKSPTTVVEPHPRPFDANMDIGVAVAGVECSELFIRNKELKHDDEIQVVVADNIPQET